MASIFEELMNGNHQLTESVLATPRRRAKTEGIKKINLKNIKVESRRIFKESDLDELDTQFAVEPETAEEKDDEVVLIIDPEIPADEEVPEDAAENLIGDSVYKCPICGANYACGCDDEGQTEGVEVDENGVPTECPICGDDAEQILIGEIAPIEGAGEEGKLDPVDADDAEDEVVEEEEEEVSEEEAPAEEESVEEEVPEDEEILEEEGLKLSEDVDVDADVNVDDVDVDVDTEGEEKPLVLDPILPEEEKEEAPVVEINDSEVTLMFDDRKLERLMGKVVSENYHGNPAFKVTKVATRRGKFVVEYLVREGKKTTRGKLVGEGFTRDSRAMKIKFVDKGAFTESFAKTPSFVVECVRIRNVVTPVSMSYDYKVRVNESIYRVHGKVGR